MFGFNKKPVYVIEHLDSVLGKWSLIEYEHISQIVGGKNVWFTNIKKKGDRNKLEKFGKVFSERFSELGIPAREVCVLDPDAKKTLAKDDGKRLHYFIFGGILGDFPAKKRTKKELTKFISGETRNIGKKQFSTDNAVYVTKKILGGEGKKLKFMDKVELKFGEFESVELPFRYPVVDGKPFMSEKIVNYLKNKKGF